MISCQNKNENKINKSKTVIEEKENKVEKILNEPLNIYDLKIQRNLLITSGVIPISETKRFCKTDSVGFFGFYTLIDKSSSERIGKLNIFTTVMPENWKLESNNEKFVSIETRSNKIKIWNIDFIGMSENELLDFIGERFHYKKGQLIYSSFDKFDGAFWIKNDTIEKLEIKRVCEKRND